jgi:20S proteasome alpha/beta subunit
VLAIRDIKVGCSYIIAGFDETNDSMIIQSNEQGYAYITEAGDFAAIGEGAYLAESSLLQREYMEIEELGDAIYYVYEAKRFAQRIGSVSPKTEMVIIGPNEKHWDMDPQGYDFLAERFKQLGPQPVEDNHEVLNFLRGGN